MTLDLAAVMLVVTGAVLWLVTRFRSPGTARRRAPACHQTAPAIGPSNGGAPNVIIGGALAKGLQRAERARNSEKRVKA